MSFIDLMTGLRSRVRPRANQLPPRRNPSELPPPSRPAPPMPEVKPHVPMSLITADTAAIVAEQRRTNELLEQLLNQLEGARLAPASSIVPDDHEERSRAAIDSMFGRTG